MSKVYQAGDDYPLSYPVEVLGKDGAVLETIRSVRLRRLKGADMRAIADATAKGKGAAMAELVARAASLPPSLFDLLDGEDISALGEVAQGFIGGALPTGAA